MRFPVLTAALAALSFALPVAAQNLKTVTMDGTRAETRMITMSDDFSVFALATLTYGQPEWKAEYDGMLDKLKGKMNRLGKDWFTTLVTTAPLEIGGAKLPAGSYILGLHCDKDGKFALAFMDASKATKDGVTPFAPWSPEHAAPLTLNKDAAKDVVGKMTISFGTDGKDPGHGTFTIAWGKHTLTAPVVMHAHGADHGKQEEHGKKDEHGKGHGK